MRKAFSGLAIVLLLAVVAQFFLAASGAFDSASTDEAFAPHRMLGYGILAFAVLLTIAAAVARLPGRLIGMAGLVAGLVVLQSVIGAVAEAIGEHAGTVFFGLHAVNALVIIAVAMRILRQARELAS